MFNSYRLLPAHGFEPCSGGGAEETRERFPAQPRKGAQRPQRVARRRRAGTPDGPPFTRKSPEHAPRAFLLPDHGFEPRRHVPIPNEAENPI